MGLIKIMRSPDDQEYFRNGKLYMNRVKYFIDSEENEIGDSSEAISVIKNLSTGQLNIREISDAYRPIFCMSAIKQSDIKRNGGVVKIDRKLLDFGEYAVVITDVKKFIGLIRAVTPSMYASFVQYIDFDKVNEAIFNPIVKKKRNKYGHQHEFRIFTNTVYCAGGDELSVQDIDGFTVLNDITYTPDIGDIHDISVKCLTEDLVHGIKSNFHVDWEFAKTTNFNLYNRNGWRRNAGDNW